MLSRTCEPQTALSEIAAQPVGLAESDSAREGTEVEGLPRRPKHKPGSGIWVPNEVAGILRQIDFNRRGLSPVFQTILQTCLRYNTKVARLATKDLMRATGLPERTVKR